MKVSPDKGLGPTGRNEVLFTEDPNRVAFSTKSRSLPCRPSGHPGNQLWETPLGGFNCRVFLKSHLEVIWNSNDQDVGYFYQKKGLE